MLKDCQMRCPGIDLLKSAAIPIFQESQTRTFIIFCNRFVNGYVIQSMNNFAYLRTEAMPNQSLQSFAEINPLVGLPPKTLRLYNALEIFKKRYCSSDNPDWFRMPRRDPLLQKIGFSETDIENGIQELVQADLLEIQEGQDATWYCLK